MARSTRTLVRTRTLVGNRVIYALCASLSTVRVCGRVPLLRLVRLQASTRVGDPPATRMLQSCISRLRRAARRFQTRRRWSRTIRSGTCWCCCSATGEEAVTPLRRWCQQHPVRGALCGGCGPSLTSAAGGRGGKGAGEEEGTRRRAEGHHERMITLRGAQLASRRFAQGETLYDIIK